jgi:allophanate hydrolase
VSGHLTILSAGPALTLQDLGRSGYLAYGLTRGGAADVRALYEGAALLGQSPGLAAIEMTGMGGTFQSDVDTVIALTGAEMTAEIDGARLIWHASHGLPAGAILKIGGVTKGTYGYLSIAGGFDTELRMGARSTHLTAGVGGLLTTGMVFPLGQAGNPRSGYFITPESRLEGGALRIVPSVQTEQFAQDTRDRFGATAFRRDARGNRQGVRMDFDGEGFFADGGLSIVSEVILEGDIQITGDGAPYVLMCECQTTGGYPRIGTVIPSDLPRVSQAPVGAPLTFRFITLAEARTIEMSARAALKALPQSVLPIVRDPKDIPDLLSYQLVGGVVSATSEPPTAQGDEP